LWPDKNKIGNKKRRAERNTMEKSKSMESQSVNLSSKSTINVRLVTFHT